MARKKTSDLIVNLIEENFHSDADFERLLGLKPKTVCNWKRGTSSSYLHILPEIATALGVSPNFLLDFEEHPLENDETELVAAYRKSNVLSDSDRKILLSTLKNVINLKLTS